MELMVKVTSSGGLSVSPIIPWEAIVNPMAKTVFGGKVSYKYNFGGANEGTHDLELYGKLNYDPKAAKHMFWEIGFQVVIVR